VARERGFTLLEVLIAFVIAALSLAAMIRAAGFGLAAAHESARYQEALSRAQSHLAALGTDAGVLAGTREGDDGGGFRWRLEIAPNAAPKTNLGAAQQSPAPPLYFVIVTVYWREGDRARAVSLQTERLGRAAAS
jgi:general secretion pathway protein I